MITREELVAKYERTVDEHLVKDLAHHIHDGYQDALDKCCDLDKEFARQAIPQMRHYSIQSRVKAVACSHDGVSVQTRFTKKKSEPYAVLTVGDFLITISMVKATGSCRGRPTSGASTPSPTITCFRRSKPNSASTRTRSTTPSLSTFLSQRNKRPSKMSLVFPNSDYTCSIHTIDLTPLVDFELERTSVPQETIPPPVPTLRKRLPKKGAM